jgi:hypothetical protein
MLTQSGGSNNVNVRSVLTGLNGPLLWIVAELLTPKLVPADADGGPFSVTPVTFTSAFVITATVAGAEAFPLFPPFGSFT